MSTNTFIRDDELKLANGTAIMLDADEISIIVTRKDNQYRFAFWNKNTIDEWFEYLNSEGSDWSNKELREARNIPHPLRVYDFDEHFVCRELVPVED